MQENSMRCERAQNALSSVVWAHRLPGNRKLYSRSTWRRPASFEHAYFVHTDLLARSKWCFLEMIYPNETEHRSIAAFSCTESCLRTPVLTTFWKWTSDPDLWEGFLSWLSMKHCMKENGNHMQFTTQIWFSFKSFPVLYFLLVEERNKLLDE